MDAWVCARMKDVSAEINMLRYKFIIKNYLSLLSISSIQSFAITFSVIIDTPGAHQSPKFMELTTGTIVPT